MQKIIFLLLIIFLSVNGRAQSSNINSDISNSKTDKHINIPGTRLYIIPPENFSVANAHTGLQKGDNAAVTVYDLVGGNFYSNAATFSKEAFESQGAKVFEYKEIEVNGFPCKYIFLQGDPNAKAIAMVFGDTTFSTMIMCIYPVADQKTGSQLISSLNTIYYDKSKKINPFENANFSLDNNASRFKFLKYAANVYMYSDGGKDNSNEKNAPMVLVTPLPRDNTMTSKTLADMFVGKMQQYGFTKPEIKNPNAEKLNGNDAYRVEVHGQMNGEASLLYLCAVTKGDMAIVIQAISKKDLENDLVEFKKLAATLKLK